MVATVDRQVILVNNLLNKLSKNSSLSDVQELVFRQCYLGRSYKEIADNSGYEYDYIKKVGSQLWRSLSQALGQKISKSNLRSQIYQYTLHKGLNSAVVENYLEKIPSPIDWGQATDVEIFYGRESELKIGHKWIIGDRCRLVAIVGLAGMGKTSASVKLTQQVKKDFEYIIWRSLRDAPPLKKIITDAIFLITQRQDITLPKSELSCLSLLIKYLQQYRCLLVLDNLETILYNDNYLDGYENYGEFFRRIGEVNHQSCLIITSRQIPQEIAALEGDILPVRLWQIKGLDSVAGKQLLAAKGLKISTKDSDKLIQFYQGNALALKIAATAIKDIYEGDVSQFLAQETNPYCCQS